MKDKKRITAVLVSITGALRKGFDILNDNGQLPEVTDDDLAVMGPHIVKGLRASLATIEENARFEGLTYEEILEKKDAEKQEGIRKNLEAAGEALKALRAEPEPVELDDAYDNETDEGDEGPGDDEPDNDETEKVDEDPENDETGDKEPDTETLYGYSLTELNTMKAALEKKLENVDAASPEFEFATAKLATIKNFINELKSQQKPQE